ncbi:hypothetical protein SAMD00019534_067050 [Acytostelium subglobosum LB1]|uniref:hypothetical protein n=1 Tax=Acytostelium subglobosum LB1 TaxID=1410327 RepID=UPI000644DA8B|nr:hypothetical protein SAMD00019534_067050 [Acytostelium subglobosum LB1]GAM23530.1 hypothetical protein SAMD00019534_067050 [Acytostelium subglobosum LB1]|eukprot:XP_012753271.1 hypothetical protein SAMD00019534_067050 [Acytostelium subglobosum LB1]
MISSFIYILLLGLSLNFINGQEISSIYYLPNGRASVNGTGLSSVSNVFVRQHLNGGGEILRNLTIMNKTDVNILVGFNQTISVFNGEIDLCDASNNCTTYQWNPVIITSVNSIPTEGGVISVSGEYLLQSNYSTPNTLEFGSFIILNETRSNNNGTISMYNMTTSNAEMIPTRSTNILITIRGTQYQQLMNFKDWTGSNNNLSSMEVVLDQRRMISVS